MVKPFEPEVLRAKVAAFVEMYRNTRKLQNEIAQRRKTEAKLDASNDLLETISRALSHGPATVVIDLSDVSDVDSAGLSVLVYACRAATAAHVKLVLYSLPPLALELLEPTRLSDLGDVDIEPTMPVPLHSTA